MVADLQPAPLLNPVVSSEDDVEHIVCCDDNLSLCGLPLDDSEEIIDYWDEDDDNICELCVRVVDEPCGHPKCPDRKRWWQVWR